MEDPIKMDDLGVQYLPILGNPQIGFQWLVDLLVASIFHFSRVRHGWAPSKEDRISFIFEMMNSKV